MWAIILLLLSSYVSCLDPVKEYFIRRDLLNGVKAPEFSIFDPSGKNLQYRIESRYLGLHSVELIQYPSKQVVGKLSKKATLFLYEGTFEVLDLQTQQWITGTIKQNIRFLNHRSLIEFNGKSIWMEHSIGSLTTQFLDEQQGNQIMAEYKVTLHSVLWATKYTLKVYSQEVPDAVYLFGLAVRDYIITEKKLKSKSKPDALDIINQF